ncbi:archease [Candidatus Oleimmundimicrobium sp.]|uniref:archease n=1 Tax=Candidatus Oleimmundimicrobium sp. TaxID=3060597 RepID=UPI002726EBE7|nr:archease [Candidatus Oleimmundimicrobium sp.]MDO8886374.1 archease [Candidatus Oleimmundimicrobium sp.]
MAKTKQFDILEHTADVGLAAYGRSLKEVFENAAVGMFSLVADLNKVGDSFSCELKVENEDREGLLVEWLNELIYVSEVQEVILKKFNITHLEEDGRFLTAKAYGEKIDLSRHQIKTQIKACTYHNLKIEKNKIWEARVIFDI